MRRAIWVLGLVILAGCARNGSAPATGHQSAPAGGVEASASPSACIDQASFDEHNMKAYRYVADAVKAIRAYDLPSAQTDMRLSASEVRAAGDELAVADAGAAEHYDRAADLMEQAATQTGKGNLDASTSIVTEGTNELKQVDVSGEFCGAGA